MAQDHSIRQMWTDLALPQLTRSIGMSVGPIKVLLAFFMVLTICGIGSVMDLCCRTVVVNPDPQDVTVPELAYRNELAAYIDNPSKTITFIEAYRDSGKRGGVFTTLWNFMAVRFNSATTGLLELGRSNLFANFRNALGDLWLCIRALGWALRCHTLYSIVLLSFSVLSVCYFGGAICRCAALEFAQEERPGLGEALQFAGENFRNLVAAPLVPIGIILLFSAIVILIGCIGNLPAGELVVAILFGLLLLFGLMMAMLIFATAAGAMLLFPAVAYEQTTGLDAIGRSFSYVLNKPLWMIFYTVIESILATLFYLFIRFFVFLVLRLTYIFVDIGMFSQTGQTEKLERIWSEPTFFHLLARPQAPMNGFESAASVIISMILLLIVGLVMALIVSYFFTATTILYGLMRKKVDHTEITQVSIHLEEIRQSDTQTQE